MSLHMKHGGHFQLGTNDCRQDCCNRCAAITFFFKREFLQQCLDFIEGSFCVFFGWSIRHRELASLKVTIKFRFEIVSRLRSNGSVLPNRRLSGYSYQFMQRCVASAIQNSLKIFGRRVTYQHLLAAPVKSLPAS